MRSKLSTIWIFATLNYLYCDVVTLMDPGKLSRFLSGNVGGMEINQGFLLGASVLVEIPIAMALSSRLLGQRANRVANVSAGTAMTVVQMLTLLIARPAPYYVFFSLIEIASTAAVVWLAWRWSAARGSELEQAPQPRQESIREPGGTR